MTSINRVGAAAPNALRTVYPSELALVSNPDILHWWQADHAQRWSAGLEGRSRKRPFLTASLVNPAGIRPGTTTGIDNHLFLTTPSTDDPVPPTILTVDGAVPTSGDFTIWTIIGKLGTSASATAVSIVGNSGNMLRINTRSGGIIRVVIDASSTGPLEATGVTDAPHLIEFSYVRATNTGHLRVDNLSKGTAVMTGWTQATGRLSFLNAYDLTGGASAFGRTLTLNTVIVAKVAYTPSTSARQAVHAMVADVFPSITLAA